MSRQNPASSWEPGKSALRPTMAIGSLRTGALPGGIFQLAGRIRKQALGDAESCRSKLLRTGERSRSVEQIQPYFRYGAVLDGLKKRSGHPRIERAHGRSAPDLIIHAPRGVALHGPLVRAPQIPAKYQSHAMLRVAFGAFRFLWIGFLKISPRLFPDARHRLPEYIFFKLSDYPRRDLFERFMRAVNFIELGRPLRKEQAALEHLHLDAEFEHIAGRSHGHVGDTGRGQQTFSVFAEAALASALIDGTSQYISRAQSKRRAHRAGSADTAGRADSGRSRELVLILQLVSQRENRREQSGERPVVGVTT